MVAFGFLNPLLLWGLLAASLPIIIHLLNRRRFKTVRWAAMEYLLAAMKENKRRIRLEQLLLLLLRTAIVALFVFALARPMAEGSELFGLLRSRAHHVVLVDDSGSMGQRLGNTTFLGLAQEQVEQLVSGLKDRRPDDLVTVIRASRATRPDFTTERPASALIAGLKEIFRDSSAFPDRLPPGPLLEEGAKRVKDVKGPTEDRVYLVSDFRQIDWISDDGQPTSETLAALRKYDLTRTRFLFLPVGNEEVENLGISEIRRKDRQAVVGVPVTFEVEVANRGMSSSPDAEVTLEVDGASRIVRPLPSLSGGEAPRVLAFTHTFREPGSHHVTASLPADRFPLDDRRSLALQVVERTKAVIADGDPGERTDAADSFFLAVALDPGSGQSVSGIGVEIIGDHVLKEKELHDVDLLALTNVPISDEAVATKLEEYVRSGGGLLIFMGNQIDPTLYNNLLFKKGEGPLPCALVEVKVQDEDPLSLVIADATHETVSKAAEEMKALLGISQIGRYYSVAADVGADAGKARPDSAVILRYGNEEGPPAVIAKTFGKGKVVLFTMPADRDWGNSWPWNPSYVTFLQQVYEFAVRSTPTAPFNVTPRTSFTHLLDPAAYAPEVSVRKLSAEGEGDERVFTAVAENATSDRLTLTVGDLGQVGVYRALLKPRGAKEEPLFFSVNPDPREGILHRVPRGALARVYPKEIVDRLTVIERAQLQTSGLGGDEGEMWKMIAAAVLGFLFLETLLAWRFGHR